MALSKKDLQIHITLNELYNTQSLLVQHLDVLVGIGCEEWTRLTDIDRPRKIAHTSGYCWTS